MSASSHPHGSSMCTHIHVQKRDPLAPSRAGLSSEIHIDVTKDLIKYNMPMKSTTILAPGETTLIALNGTSQFYLKHTTPDQINLIDGNGAIAHSAQWTSTLEGGSLINNTETHAGAGQSGTNAPTTSTTWGMDDWVNSAWATPGRSGSRSCPSCSGRRRRSSPPPGISTSRQSRRYSR